MLQKNGTKEKEQGTIDFKDKRLKGQGGKRQDVYMA